MSVGRDRSICSVVKYVVGTFIDEANLEREDLASVLRVSYIQVIVLAQNPLFETFLSLDHRKALQRFNC